MTERDKFGKFVKGSTIGKSTQFKKGSSGQGDIRGIIV